MRFPSPSSKFTLPKIRQVPIDDKPEGFGVNKSVNTNMEIEPRVLKLYGRKETKSVLDTHKRRSRSYDPMALISEFFKMQNKYDE